MLFELSYPRGDSHDIYIYIYISVYIRVYPYASHVSCYYRGIPSWIVQGGERRGYPA